MRCPEHPLLSSAWCCLSDTIQCIVLHPRTLYIYSSTRTVDIFDYFIVTTNNNCTYMILVRAQGCGSLISCVSYCIAIFENAPDNFSYAAGCYHISWKTSLKSYGEQAPPTKEGACTHKHCAQSSYKYMI